MTSRRPKRNKIPLVRRMLPRTKKGKREMELLGGAVLATSVLFIGAIFLATSMQRILVTSPQVAAVISSVLVDLTNGDRAANNLSMLKVNPTLVAVAQAKANDMAAKGYFSHITPEGHEPWHWFEQAGYAFEYAGENLAVDFTESMDVERAWMNSPTHRKNILDPHFTEIGIATAVGTYQGRATVFVAQAFGKPAPEREQARIESAVVPRNPTETAVAVATVQRSESAVLGSSAAPPAERSADPALVEPAVAAELAIISADDRPFWSFLVSFPRETLRTAYFTLGILILLALAIETGLEIRWHHRRRAARAGALLVIMALCFTVAETWFFVEPVVALAEGSL